jgi:hypothetical protein
MWKKNMPLLFWIVIFRVDIRWWLTRWAMGSMTCASCTTGSLLCSLHISIFDRIVLHKLRPKTSISAFPLKSMVPSLLRCTLTMSVVLIKCWGFEEDTRKESGKGLFGLGGYKCRDNIDGMVIGRPYFCIHLRWRWSHIVSCEGCKLVMYRLRLGLKALALAWLWVAQASPNHKPGPKPKRWLGLAWLWSRPGLMTLQSKQIDSKLKAHHLNPQHQLINYPSSCVHPHPLHITIIIDNLEIML